MDGDSFDSDGGKYPLRLSHNVLGVHVLRHFQLDGPHVRVRAQRPEVGFLNGIHSGESRHFLVTVDQAVIEGGRLPLHQDHDALFEEREDAEADERRYKHGADGVGSHPAELVHEQSGHDDSDGAEGIGEDVQEDAFHYLRVSADGLHL